jgi:ankyrin repeat protein
MDTIDSEEEQKLYTRDAIADLVKRIPEDTLCAIINNNDIRSIIRDPVILNTLNWFQFDQLEAICKKFTREIYSGAGFGMSFFGKLDATVKNFIWDTSCMGLTDGHVEVDENGYEKTACRNLKMGAERGHIECIKRLLKLGHPRDKYTCSVAVEHGHLECVLELRPHDYNPNTICLIAAKHGHLNIIKYFNDDDYIYDLMEVLAEAAAYDHLDIVAFLLEALDEEDRIDTEVLSVATSLECMKLMMSHGIPMTPGVLEQTAKFDRFDMFKHAVDNGCYRDDDALESIVCYGGLRYLRCLPYDTYKDCKEVGYWAAEYGHADILCYLVEQDYKFPPSIFRHAAYSDDARCLSVLYEHGYRIQNDNLSVFTAAAVKGKVDIFKFLIDVGAPIRKSAIEMCARNGHIDCLKLLTCPGYKWYKYWADVARAAASRNKTECLRYIYEYVTEPHRQADLRSWKTVIETARRSQNIECHRYAVSVLRDNKLVLESKSSKKMI